MLGVLLGALSVCSSRVNVSERHSKTLGLLGWCTDGSSTQRCQQAHVQKWLHRSAGTCAHVLAGIDRVAAGPCASCMRAADSCRCHQLTDSLPPCAAVVGTLCLCGYPLAGKLLHLQQAYGLSEQQAAALAKQHPKLLCFSEARLSAPLECLRQVPEDSILAPVKAQASWVCRGRGLGARV